MTDRHVGTDQLAAELRGWLTDRIAAYVGRTAASIEDSVPLVDYGVDSVFALILCGDLEDELRLTVGPTLVGDHPTVAALVRHLTPLLALASDGER